MERRGGEKRGLRGTLEVGAAWLAIILFTFYALVLILEILQNPDRFQHDFRSYYYAGLAFREGLNPYDPAALSSLLGEPIGFPFIYAPVTLPLFSAFSLTTYLMAYRLFLLLKVLVMVAAILAAWRMKGHLAWLPAAGFFLLVGFNGAGVTDLRVGNVAIFEAALIWAAVVAWLKGRYPLFVLLILLASSFKLTPILLLALLIFTHEPRRCRMIGAGMSLFLILHGGSFLLKPEYLEGMGSTLLQLQERGARNPTVFAGLGEVMDLLHHKGFALPEILPAALTFLVSAVILLLTARSLQGKGSRLHKALLVMFGFAIILPRFKDYSYVLLSLPALFAVERLKDLPSLWILLLLCLAPVFPLPYGWGELASRLFWGYYPLLGAVAVWTLLLLADRAERSDQIRSFVVRGEG